MNGKKITSLPGRKKKTTKHFKPRTRKSKPYTVLFTVATKSEMGWGDEVLLRNITYIRPIDKYFFESCET
jgi:hypothetical protein